MPCKSLAYAPSNCAWINRVLRQVALDNGLDFDQDFLGMGDGAFPDDNQTLYEHIVAHQNQTQNALWFWEVSIYGCHESNASTSVPDNIGYVVWYNLTSGSSTYPFELMLSLDTVLLRERAASTPSASAATPPPSLATTIKSFPHSPPRLQGYDVVSSSQNWFYVPPMITFFLLLTEIVAEKEMHLRIGMKMMGLSNTVYWLVWFLTGLVFITLSSVLLILAGMAAQFPVFLNANFMAMFLTFFTYGIST
jgi:hypothetical protein